MYKSLTDNRSCRLFVYILLVFGVNYAATFIGAAKASEPTRDSSPREAETTSNVLEEIIVTAQRREESLQQVPVAITYFDATRIDELGIYDLDAIETFTPGFGFSSFSLGQPQLYIRGIGSNEDSAGGDPSVAVYLDGIYLARGSAMAFNYFNLERIEVLRGPQGTLYGKNATGGVINIITEKPHMNFESAVRVTLGNLDHKIVQAKLNLPLSPNLSSNFAANFNKRKGYVNTPVGNAHSLDDWGVRGQIYAVPNESLEISFAADYARIDRTGSARQATGGGIDELYSPGVRESEQDFLGFQRRKAGGARFELNWDYSWGTLTSLTGYRESDYQWFEDGLGLPVEAPALDFNDIVDETSEQFSQELRLISLDDLDLSWLGGIYLLRENAHRVERFDVYNFGPPTGSVEDLTGERSISNTFNQRNRLYSYAAFGETNYLVNRQWAITLGLRYTYEKKRFSNSADDSLKAFPILIQAPFEYEISEQKDWGALTWKLLTEHQHSNQLKSYVSVARGFKSGGFQGQAATADSAATPFDPEYAINYELGIKSQWLQNRLRLNASIFYLDYSDLQVLQFVEVAEGTIQTTENAADAISQGVELEYQWRIDEYLDLFGFYAYNDTEYKKFMSVTGDLSGNELRNAPNNSLASTIRYSNYPIEDLKLIALLSYQYRDATFQDVNNYPINKFDTRKLIDASLTLSWSDEQYSVKLYGKNITNEVYQTHTFQTNNGDISSQNFGPPRTYGIVFFAEFR